LYGGLKVIFSASVSESGGEYEATCAEMGISVYGLSQASALDMLREEIRYRIEFCPCTTVNDDFVQLNVLS
jgi:hypothetical protein